MGAEWARHAMCESAFNRSRRFGEEESLLVLQRTEPRFLLSRTSRSLFTISTELFRLTLEVVKRNVTCEDAEWIQLTHYGV